MAIATRGLALAALLIVAGAVEAKTLSLRCEFPGGESGVFTEEVRITLDDATGGAVVDDAITRRNTGGAVAGQVTDSATKRMIRWTVPMSNKQAQRTRMQYTLNLFKDERGTVLRAKPYGYGNDFDRKGTCAQARG